MEEMRLQKYMAEAGIASRRKAEELIALGKVSVNGKIVTEMGIKVVPGRDIVEYKGRKISLDEEKIYILLNKPIGYVTTAKDQFSRETVLDLVKTKHRIVPVGRLDMYTSGALMLSNDGDFVYKITHPKNEIEKTYNITIKGGVTEEELNKVRNGIRIEDYVTSPAKVRILKVDKEKNITRIEVVIHEGKNREVRKMFETLGKHVLALHRAKIGNIAVNNMELGTWRYLSEKEIEYFMK